MSTKTRQNRKSSSRRAKPRPSSRRSAPAAVITLGKPELIDLARIKFTNKKDREGLSDEALDIAGLAKAIASVGLLQPIDVVRLPNGDCELAFGERRIRAHKHLKRSQILAFVHNEKALTPAVLEKIAERRAIENCQRADPTPIGEGLAVADLYTIELQRVKDQCIKGPSQPIRVSVLAKLRATAIENVATKIGKSTGWVRDRMYISGFEGKSRDLITNGRLPLAYAREISKVADPRRRDELAATFCIDGDGAAYDGLPGDLDNLKAEVAKTLYSLVQVPWSLSAVFDKKPACEECPFNSANNPGLFDGKQLFADDHQTAHRVGEYNGVRTERTEPKTGVCTKPECYREKASFCSRAVSGTVTKVLNASAAAKARKDKGAAALLTPSAIAKVTPPFLAPSVVHERVKSRLASKRELPASKASKSAEVKKKPGDYGTPEWHAKNDGQQEYQEAFRNWLDKKAMKAFAGYIAEVPGRFAMFALVRCTKAYEKVATWNMKPADLKSPDFLHALRLVEKPSIENAIELEKMAGKNYGLFVPPRIDHSPPEMVHFILTTLSVAVDAPPVEKEYIDAELAKLNRDKAAVASGKKPAEADGK
ncbi:MAG: ParB/RepB/Spo0J family partition protein [Phycisphaerales bacterium]